MDELQPRTHRTYGWVPDVPDFRDKVKKPTPYSSFVSKWDARNSGWMPSVYDQGDLGSCTANAIGADFEYIGTKQKEPVVMPSRLFIYYNERVMEGDVSEDNGAQIRDGITTTLKLGVCPESLWPYVPSKFAVKPPTACYTQALKHKALTAVRVPQTLNDFKNVLVNQKDCFVLGFTVYESFESETVATTGIMPMPSKNEGVLGGHAVMCVGYDDSKEALLIRNSWGTSWGLEGYFYMPYAYATNPNLCDDFWVIESEQ